MNIQLSPFVPQIKQDCAQLLRSLLSLPQETSIQWSGEVDSLNVFVRFSEWEHLSWLLRIGISKSAPFNLSFKHIKGPKELFLRLVERKENNRLPIHLLPTLPNWGSTARAGRTAR